MANIGEEVAAGNTPTDLGVYKPQGGLPLASDAPDISAMSAAQLDAFLAQDQRLNAPPVPRGFNPAAEPVPPGFAGPPQLGPQDYAAIGSDVIGDEVAPDQFAQNIQPVQSLPPGSAYIAGYPDSATSPPTPEEMEKFRAEMEQRRYGTLAESVDKGKRGASVIGEIKEVDPSSLKSSSRDLDEEMRKAHERMMERAASGGATIVDARSTATKRTEFDPELIAERTKIASEVAALQEQNAELRGKDADEAISARVMGRREADLANAYYALDKDILESRLAEEAAKRKRDVERAYASKIDPDRMLKNKTPFQKVMMAIAAALGGFAEGWSHGRVPNRALKMIQDAIDQDLEAQEGEIRQKKDLSLLKRDEFLLESFRERRDLKEAFIAKRTAAYELAASMMENIADKQRSREARLAGLTAAQQLRIKDVESRLDMAATQVSESTQPTVMSGRDAAAAGPNGLGKTLPNNVLGQIVDHRSVMKEMALLSEEFDKFGGLGRGQWFLKFAPWTEASDIESWRQSIALRAAAKDNQGKPTDRDQKFIAGTLPGPGDDGPNAARKIERFFEFMRNRHASMLNTYSTSGFDVSPLMFRDEWSEKRARAAAARLRGQ